MLKKVKYNLRKNETYYIYDCKNSNFEENIFVWNSVIHKGAGKNAQKTQINTTILNSIFQHFF